MGLVIFAGAFCTSFLIGPSAKAGAGAAEPVAMTCYLASRADGNRIIQTEAQLLCAEVRAALHGQPRPPSKTAMPAMRLIITHANTRGAGLTGVWVMPNGREVPLNPLNARFFDANSNAAMRSNFIQRFLQSNPIPVAK